MAIEIKNLTHIYNKDTVMEKVAVRDVTVTIRDGEKVGIIGHTGSGKSTLVQHLNGLLKPHAGQVIVNGIDTMSKDIKELRKMVGMVFQYPEHQLFEETVYLDIAFGPKNLNHPDHVVKKRVKKAMEMVELDYERHKDLSPFSLSGGEKRRVALAGVLAMEPKYLVLDEPTAGLDPRGRDEILSQIVELHRSAGLTVVLVSHSMDDVARLATRLIVMHKSEIIYNDEPRKIFTEQENLQKIGLDVPTVTKLMAKLREKGWAVRGDILSLAEAKAEIIKVLRGDRAHA